MVIYLNNAATSWPKPPVVISSVTDFMVQGGANFSRGAASDRDLKTMNLVLDCREEVADFFGAPDSALITFTANVTEALNIVLKGFLRGGMRVVTSSMEHNSVMRPLRSLERQGVTVEVMPADPQGYLSADTLSEALAVHTDLCVINHASNVCGSLQDLPLMAEICNARCVPLVVDCAQTAGLIGLDVTELGLAALCFTGHKSLLAPQGTGGIVWSEFLAERSSPLIEGGTGSFSHEEVQPGTMPDKFEPGTPNLPGLAGLLAGIRYIRARGADKIYEAEMVHDRALWEGLSSSGLMLYGDRGRPRVPVLSLNPPSMDNASLAQLLSSEHGIETRPGLHCAPGSHRTLGTFPQGALRLSPGSFTTPDEIDAVIGALLAAV